MTDDDKTPHNANEDVPGPDDTNGADVPGPNDTNGADVPGPDDTNGASQERKVLIVPKPAHVVTPPNVASATYKQFKSSQHITSHTVTKKSKTQIYGEMPHRYECRPSHSPHHYTPPSVPKKRISEHINTPRFQERPPSPRPGPDQYLPVLSVSGPCYSFGKKLGEKDCAYGRGRTSWEKAWFASNDVWRFKTHYEEKWPDIGQYQLNCMGKRLPHLPSGPSPSFGAKLADFSLEKRKNDPSPQAYDILTAQKHMFKAPPSYTMVRKDYSFEPWIKNKAVPGPGSYMPNTPAVKPRIPAFSFAKPLADFMVTAAAATVS